MTVDEIINDVLRLCKAQQAREVYLFGSRAKGTALRTSDIDIAVSGAEDFEALREKVEEIPTLYTIDLVNLDNCKNECLLEDIREYGRKIFEKI